MMQEMSSILTALERTAWQMRGLADEMVKLGEDARVWAERSARLSRTGWMLTQVVGDYRLYGIYSAFLSHRKSAEVLERVHRRAAARFYRASAREQGAFLKVGQMLSARPDLLPGAWIEQLAPLQDAAPPVPFAVVREVLGPLLRGLQSIDETPLAAASIGQVHRAVTTGGIEVAVKIQRPGIDALVEHDLALLETFLGTLTEMLPPTDYATIVAEVRERVRGELDYLAEGRAMAETADRFAHTPGVRVPRPIPELCGPRVLTATYHAGEKITAALERTPAVAADVLGRLLSVYLRQVLEAGLFQADPHPGNFLVTAEGDLVLLDFGCAGRLEPERRRAYRDLLVAFLGADRERVGRLLAQLGFATRSGRSDTLLAFADALLSSFRRAAAQGRFVWPTRDEVVAEAGTLDAELRRDPVTRLPPDFVMLGRVFGTLAGLFQHYRPAIDFSRDVLPHLYG